MTGSSHADGVTPNAFEGTDSERIAQAVNAAAESCGRVVIPRVNETPQGPRALWLIDSAILLPSNITLTLDGCRIRLSDRARDNIIRSANCGAGVAEIRPLENIHITGRGGAVLEGATHPRSTGDSAKTLGTRTYGADAGVRGESQKGDWRNIGILLAAVDHFGIEGLKIVDSHCWAISLEWCSGGRIRDIEFDSTESRVIDGVRQTNLNQDGLDLRVGCHDITIENITGRTGDDMVALTGIPHAAPDPGGFGSTEVCGGSAMPGRVRDIRHVIIRNIRGHSRGGHQIVRFLNTSGVRLHDIILDGLLDTSPDDVIDKAAVKIGDNNPAWGGVTPLGDTSRIFISNVASRCRSAVVIAGSLAESSIRDVVQEEARGRAIVLESGPQYLRNVTFSGIFPEKG